jgi:hypothetical protein
VNVHTVKPMDIATVIRAADETRLVVTAEEHQVGGFGNIVAGAVLQHRKDFQQPLQFGMVGVANRFGVSGKPWELVQSFGLTAEHIAKRVLDLLDDRVVVARELAPRVNAVHCAQCNAVIPLSEAEKDLPMPSGEICAGCDYRSTELCAACRVEWSHISHSAAYVCHNCR